MELNVVGRNIEVSDALRDYVQKKIGKLDRFLPNIADAQVELSKQTAKSASDRHAVQVTLRTTSGTILRAEERSGDIFASIDTVMDKIHHQIARYKGKRHDGRTRAPAEPAEPLQAEESEETEPLMARRKTFSVRPMSEEEAIEQMELLGHDFFVFYNSRSEAFNVVYRRKEGGYGLLEPEMR
jgi:putative sigma-54 modulation protein